jgi:methionyl-tRNA formyltransferase
LTIRVAFMGSPEFAVPTLRALHDAFQLTGVITQPDRPQGRGRAPMPTPVKREAVQWNIPVLEPDRPDWTKLECELREWQPDAVVVAAYGHFLPVGILKLPRLGCVNLHASLLPRHRGASPFSAAILAGDPVAGVTTMLMDQGMDTGDMLLQHEIPVLPEDTAGSLHDRLMEPGAALVVTTVQGLVNGTVKPVPQDHSKATYTSLLTKNDGRIDWLKDAAYLDRHVRAMSPWPGAFSLFEDSPLRVWSARPIEGSGEPGAIVSVTQDGIAVGTGKGLLLLTEVQASGKKRMAAEAFARGRRVQPGRRFPAHSGEDASCGGS